MSKLMVDNDIKQKIMEAIKSLSEREREIAILFYGFESQPSTVKEIAERLGMSEARIESLIGEINNKLAQQLKDIQNVHSSTSNVENKNAQDIKNNSTHKSGRKNRNFYNSFEGYSEEQINAAILKLNEKNRNIISYYYGINEDKKSVEEIADKYGMSKSSIYVLVSNIKKTIQKHLDSQEGALESKKEIKPVLIEENKVEDDAFSKENNISSENDKLLYDYLINGNEEAYEKLMDNNIKLVRHIIYKIFQPSNNDAYELVDEYLSLGCIGLHKAIKSFKKDKIGVVNLSTYASVCIRNEVLMELRKHKHAISIVSIEEKISDDENITLGDTLFSDENFVEEVGEESEAIYKKSKVLQALDTLKSREREMAILYYGFGERRYTHEEIAKKFGISRSYVSRIMDVVNNKLKDILFEFEGQYSSSKAKNKSSSKKIEKPKKIVKTKLEKFYESFEGYTKEEVDAVVLKLNEMDCNIVKDYYEFELSVEEVATKYGISAKSLSNKLYAMKKQMKSLLEGSTLELEKKAEKPKKIVKTRLEKFYESFEGYTKEEVDVGVSRLSERQRNIIRDYCELELSCEEIAIKYNMKDKSVAPSVHKIKNNIKLLLENPALETEKEITKTRLERFYKSFEGYTKEEIDTVVSKLNERDCNIIKDYYELGLSVEEIAAKYSLGAKSLTNKLSIMKKGIRTRLENPTLEVEKKIEKPKKIVKTRLEKFYENFEGYTKEEVDTVVSRLSERNRNIIRDYYELELSVEEIAAKYSLGAKSLTNKLYTMKKEIKSLLENPNMEIKKRTTKKKKVSAKKTDDSLDAPSKDNQRQIRKEKLKDNDKLLYEFLINGDEKAYEKLMENNLYFVKYVLNKIYNGDASKKAEFIDENFSLGVIALSKSIRGFDASQIGKIKFATFAAKCITNEIYMEFRRNKKNAYMLSLEDFVIGEENDITIGDTIKDDEDFVEEYSSDDYSRYKREKVAKALSLLDDRDKKIIEMFYGLNGKKYNQNQIAKEIGISQSYVSRVIDSLGQKLALQLIEFKDEYSVNKEEKAIVIKRMNDVFYSMFSDIDKKQINNELIGLLTSIEIKFVVLYYGLDRRECLDYDEIAKQYNKNVDSVINTITRAVNKLKQHYIKGEHSDNAEKEIVKREKLSKIEKFYKSFKEYTKEEVDFAVSQLSERNQDFIRDYCELELSCEEIAVKYNLKAKSVDSAVYNIVYNIKNNIKLLLEKPEIEVAKKPQKQKKIVKTRLERFYESFEGYSKEEVDIAISKLVENENNIIRDYYEFNLDTIEIAFKYDMNDQNVRKTIYTIKSRIKSLLENPIKKIAKTKLEKFHENFEGYTKEEIDIAISKLNERDRDIIKGYYELGLSVKEVAEKYNLSTKSLPNKLVAMKKEIKSLLENPTKRIAKTKLEKFYESFEGYTKEEVNAAVSKLNENDCKIIKDYYELELSAEEVAAKYSLGIKSLNNKLYVIKKEIKLLLLENPALESENKITKKRLKRFYESFEGYTKEEVDVAISKLKEENSNIIKDYYELGLSVEEVAAKYSIGIKNLNNKLYAIKKEIKSLLEKPALESENKITKKRLKRFYKSFEGYTKEEVDVGVSRLSERQRNIVRDYCELELSCEEIAVRYNLKAESVAPAVHNIKNNIKLLLENPEIEVEKRTKENRAIKNEKKFYELFEGYSKEEIDTAVSKLSEGKRNIIIDYYEQGFSYKEISQKYNLALSGIGYKIFNIRKEINNILDKRNKGNKIVKDKAEKFYSSFSGYTKEEIDIAMSKLSEDKRNIIFDYCFQELSCEEIAVKYNLKVSSVSAAVSYIKKKIKEYLNSPDLDKEKENDLQEKSKLKRSDRFYNYFKSYSKEEIQIAVSKLNERNRNIIYDYYDNLLSISEIAEKYNLKEYSVNSTLARIRKEIGELLENPNLSKKREPIKPEKIKLSRLEKFYNDFNGYTREEVDEAISKLDQRRKNMINDYYKLELGAQEMANKYNLSDKSVRTYVCNVKKEILKLLEDHNLVVSSKKTIGSRLDRFYDDFNDFTKEEVDEAIDNLSETNRNILYDYYKVGLSGKEIAEKYNLRVNSVYTTIYNITKEINSILRPEKKKTIKTDIAKSSRKEGFYNYFDKYSKEEVDEAISKLSERKRNIINDYYEVGLNDQEIGEKYHLRDKGVRTTIHRIKKEIIGLLTDKRKVEKKAAKQEKVKTSKLDKFYNSFSGHTKEEIDEVISKLSEDKRNLLHDFYVIGLSRENIVKKYSLANKSVTSIVHKIRKEISDLLDEKNLAQKEKVKETKRVKIIKQENFYLIFEGYSIDDVSKAMTKLSYYNQDIVTLYYGINTERCSLEDIGEKYNMKAKDVSKDITAAINKIKHYLENPEAISEYEEKFYKAFKGYDKEDIDNAVSLLKEDNKNILKLYFGLNGEKFTKKRIGEKYNLNEDELDNIIKESFYQIEEKLKNIKKLKSSKTRNYRFNELINKYGDDLVKESIRGLSDSEKGFLIMYYNITNTKYYSIKEICEKIKVEESLVPNLENKILEKLEMKIKESMKIRERESLIKAKQKEFLMEVGDLNKFKEAAKTLTKGEITLLGLYYGLNGKDILSLDELSGKLNIDKIVLQNRIKNIVYKVKMHFSKK